MIRCVIKDLSHKPVIEVLEGHNRSNFDCGIEPLNRYLREQASQDKKKNISTPFVLVGEEPGLVIGYYTLCSNSVRLDDIPQDLRKKLPRYPYIPATLIGRLAMDRRYQGKGYGELLLLDALHRSLTAKLAIASALVIVEAKDDKAKAFYGKFGFIPLVNYTHHLFLPMAAIEKIFV